MQPSRAGWRHSLITFRIAPGDAFGRCLIAGGNVDEEHLQTSHNQEASRLPILRVVGGKFAAQRFVLPVAEGIIGLDQLL